MVVVPLPLLVAAVFGVGVGRGLGREGEKRAFPNGSKKGRALGLARQTPPNLQIIHPKYNYSIVDGNVNCRSSRVYSFPLV